jgi:hypothetical protein
LPRRLATGRRTRRPRNYGPDTFLVPRRVRIRSEHYRRYQVSVFMLVNRGVVPLACPMASRAVGFSKPDRSPPAPFREQFSINQAPLPMLRSACSGAISRAPLDHTAAPQFAFRRRLPSPRHRATAVSPKDAALADMGSVAAAGIQVSRPFCIRNCVGAADLRTRSRVRNENCRRCQASVFIWVPGQTLRSTPPEHHQGQAVSLRAFEDRVPARLWMAADASSCHWSRSLPDGSAEGGSVGKLRCIANCTMWCVALITSRARGFEGPYVQNKQAILPPTGLLSPR